MKYHKMSHKIHYRKNVYIINPSHANINENSHIFKLSLFRMIGHEIFNRVNEWQVFYL